MASCRGDRLSAVSERATFGDVFAVSEFRALWLAYLLSVAGDQLALGALTGLVLDRTDPPLLTAAPYAGRLRPGRLRGPALSALADRWARPVGVAPWRPRARVVGRPAA